MARISDVMFGRPLFGWQRYVADVMGEVLEDGTLAYDDVLMRVPRRAGKNVLVNATTVQRCTMATPQSVWMTGQKRDNAVKRWDDVRRDLAGAKDEAIRTLARWKVSQGNEVLKFPNGSMFRPFAPDDDSLHGEQPGSVFVDELWSQTLRDKALIQAGYRPAWAFDAGQEIKFSAAGIRGRSGWLEKDTAVGRATVERQLDDPDARRGVAFFDWGLDESLRPLAMEAQVDQRALSELLALVVEAHPRPGLRVGYLRDEFDRDPADFLRAYGGLDNLDGGGEMAIPLPVWSRAEYRGDTMTPEGARFGFGVAVDPDGLESAVYAACRLSDGRGLVTRVEVAPGTRWVVGRLLQILETWGDVDSVAIGNTGLERDLADQLAAALPEGLVRPVSIPDDKAALARFVKDIEEGPRVLHDGALNPSLSEALRVAQVSRGLWARQPGQRDPFAALPAAHRAVWAADHLPEPKPARVAFRVM